MSRECGDSRGQQRKRFPQLVIAATAFAAPRNTVSHTAGLRPRLNAVAAFAADPAERLVEHHESNHRTSPITPFPSFGEPGGMSIAAKSGDTGDHLSEPTITARLTAG
jgi:hypothetical protein